MIRGFMAFLFRPHAKAVNMVVGIAEAGKFLGACRPLDPAQHVPQDGREGFPYPDPTKQSDGASLPPSDI